MALIAGLALLGAGLQTAGKLNSLREQAKLNSLHLDSLSQQADQEAAIFNITLPNLVRQQKARRGAMATQIAKGGVDVGSGSALATLSEQARIDELNVNLAKYQQAVTQNRIATDRMLTKRANKAISREEIFTAVGGGFQGLSNYLGAGGTMQGGGFGVPDTGKRDTRSFKDMMFKGFGADK